jgi:hypothetical protein
MHTPPSPFTNRLEIYHDPISRDILPSSINDPAMFESARQVEYGRGAFASINVQPRATVSGPKEWR